MTGAHRCPAGCPCSLCRSDRELKAWIAEMTAADPGGHYAAGRWQPSPETAARWEAEAEEFTPAGFARLDR